MTGVSVRGLTKDFGSVRAVDALTFTVEPGRVTGFLGPNGAGKTTTVRMMAGLIRPTAGEALINGRPYGRLTAPRRVVGALLEATGAHPGRRGRDHLRLLAQVTGMPARRVDEVLDQVGLTSAADRRAGGYSLGMRQRLGLGAALLGDPEILLLDEPANGLDPAGIAWLRSLLRDLAAEGRAVLISSHVLSEVAQTADDVVIVNEGRLRHAGPLTELDDLEEAFLRLTDTPPEPTTPAAGKASGKAAASTPGQPAKPAPSNAAETTVGKAAGNADRRPPSGAAGEAAGQAAGAPGGQAVGESAGNAAKPGGSAAGNADRRSASGVAGEAARRGAGGAADGRSAS